jgi:RecA/RadA recombinase
MPPRKKEIAPDLSFFSTVKTGDKIADSGRIREVNTWIDTGCYAMNAIISGDMTKGFPGNRVIMLAGEQAVGKTLMAGYSFARPLSEMGYFIFYIDTENAVTDEQLLSYGIREGGYKIITQSVVEDLKVNFDTILTQLEEAMGRKMVNPNKCAFIIDSQGMLDTLKSRSEIQKGNHVSDMTAQKELKRFYKSILVRLGVLNVPMLITNHVYANIGGYGDPTTIAGGSGGLYASSVILHLRKKQYKEGTVRKGTVLVAKDVKSRYCIDGQEAQMYLAWDSGLNKFYGMHIFAEDANLIEKWSASKFDKKGVVGPEKAGNSNWYVIKDPKLPPEKWIVCLEKDLHKKSTIFTIFDEINEFVGKKFKLKKPVDFSYNDEAGDDEDEKELAIDDDNLVDVETVASKAKAKGVLLENDDE